MRTSTIADLLGQDLLIKESFEDDGSPQEQARFDDTDEFFQTLHEHVCAAGCQFLEQGSVLCEFA
jgi:hypothetical protein